MAFNVVGFCPTVERGRPAPHHITKQLAYKVGPILANFKV